MPPLSNLTEITVILDRSGSMQSIASDAIGGFNAFTAAQRREPNVGCGPSVGRGPGPDAEAESGTAVTRLTLVLFNDRYEVAIKSVPLPEVPDLTEQTFLPRGNTALLDAIGRTLSKMTRSFAARPAEARPAKVIVAILTDGLENASREYTQHHIADLISEKRAQGWEFVFLAADQDAIATAASLSIPAADVGNFCRHSSRNAFAEMSAKVSEKRMK